MDLHKNGHPQPAFMYMLSNKHRHGVIIFVHSRPAILNQFSICFTFYSKTINKSFWMDMAHNNWPRTRSVFIKSIDGLTSTALALSLLPALLTITISFKSFLLTQLSNDDGCHSADPEESLNKRTELRQGCRHKAKFKLNNFHPP